MESDRGGVDGLDDFFGDEKDQLAYQWLRILNVSFLFYDIKGCVRLVLSRLQAGSVSHFEAKR